MFVTRTQANLIEKLRIEAEYYDPAKLKHLAWVGLWRGRTVPLERLAVFITDGTHVTPDYTKSGFHFLSSTNINAFWIEFDNTKFISKEEHNQLRQSKCSPDAGDILISKNGRIGTAARFLPSHPSCSLFVSIALVRYNGDLDPDYVVATLNSSVCWHQFARASKTGVITNLHLEELREIVIPKPRSEVQLYIGNKVRLAERLREESRRLRTLAEALIEALLHKQVSESELSASLIEAKTGESRVTQYVETTSLEFFNSLKGKDSPFSDRCSKVSANDLTNRMDAGYYSPIFLDNARLIRASPLKFEEIGKIAIRCNCGATPKDVAYAESGQGLIRTSDVRPNRFMSEGVMRTTELSVESDSAVAALPDDLVYTMSGTVGYAAVIPKVDEIFSFSNTIARVRFANDSGCNPYFIAGFLNSRMGFLQSIRLTSGGIQGHVMPNPFKKILVPVPDRGVQDLIGDKLRIADRLSRWSSQMTRCAVSLVESLIDGRLGEEDLVLAHSDPTADRALLQRLTVKGLDIEGQPPLFPDLEALLGNFADSADRFTSAV